jgi:hypothetical protein
MRQRRSTLNSNLELCLTGFPDRTSSEPDEFGYKVLDHLHGDDFVQGHATNANTPGKLRGGPKKF